MLRLLPSLPLLVACAACAPETAVVAKQYMPAQANGLGLGLTWEQVQRVRPGAFADDQSVWEPIRRNQSNSYLFGSNPRSVWKNGTFGTLQAVIVSISVPVGQSATYEALIAELHDEWRTTAGAPTDTLHYAIPFTGSRSPVLKQALIWRLPEVCLMLQYDAERSVGVGSTRLVRAVIYHHGVSSSFFLPTSAIPVVEKRPCLMR
jgi:hypothetical protein